MKRFYKKCIVCGSMFPIRGKIMVNYEWHPRETRLRTRRAVTCSHLCSNLLKDRKRWNNNIDRILEVKLSGLKT